MHFPYSDIKDAGTPPVRRHPVLRCPDFPPRTAPDMCVKTVQSNHSADSDFQITVKFTLFIKNKENQLLFAGQYKNRLQTSQDCRILFCFNSAIFCGGTMDPQPPQDAPNASTTATPSRAENTLSYFAIIGLRISFLFCQS